MKKKLLISFSGGRTSAYMTWWLHNIWKERDNYEMITVFANTGKEREETLDFIKQCDRYYGFKTIWIEAVTNMQKGKGVFAKVIDFNTASRNGEPFEAMITKHGIPNRNRSNCSRELKGYAVKSYLRQIGWKKYQIAIGIRNDEIDRMNPKFKEEKILYPLIQIIRTTKSDINLFWSKQPFDLRLKSYEGNCDLCWKKSNRKLMTIVKNNPEVAGWWKGMEEKYKDYIPNENKNTIVPVRFFRDSKTISEIILASQNPFLQARDESNDIDKFKQKELFDETLDNGFGCIESCEAF